MRRLRRGRIRNQFTLGSESACQLAGAGLMMLYYCHHLPRSRGGSGRSSSPGILAARILPSYNSCTCRSVTRKNSSYIRSRSSDGRSKKRKGCILTGSSSSMSSSDVGDGARDGIAEGGETGGAVAADCFAREATGFDLRFFAMSYCSTVVL